MDLAEISRINRQRCDRWHASGTPWTSADWSNALGGEAGELLEVVLKLILATSNMQNYVKKLRRHESGVRESYNTPEAPVLLKKIKDEIADVFLYLDLAAHHFNWDLLEDCISPKFNLVSEINNFPERL